MTPSGRVWLTMLSLLAVTSCYTKELAELSKQIQDVNGQVTKLQTAVEFHEKELSKLWRAAHCTNPKVGELMDELEHCDSDQCTDRNIEHSLNYGFDEPHVVMRVPLGVDPKQVLKSVDPIRGGQIADKLRADKIAKGVSRILFLAMAVGKERDRIENGQKAMNVARQLKSELYQQYKQHLLGAPLIGPFRVTCKERTQILTAYSRKIPDDRPVGNEPRGNSPHIVIWLFKVDC